MPRKQNKIRIHGTAAAALAAGLLWPWTLGSLARGNATGLSTGRIPVEIMLKVTTTAAPSYVRLAMKDPLDELQDAFDDMQDELEDALDDLEDELEDALDEEPDGDLDGNLEEDFEDDNSGPGGGGDGEESAELDGNLEENFDDDRSGHGGGDDDADEDQENDEDGEDDSNSDEDRPGSNSGSDEDSGKDHDDGDRSGSNSGSDKDSDKDDDDGDRSGRRGGDDGGDRSGSNSGSDNIESDYREIVDDDGFLAAERELLVLTDRDELERGELADADTEVEYELPALGMVMVRVRLAEDDDMYERLAALQERLGEDAADFNHSYAAEAAGSPGEAAPAALASPLHLVNRGLVPLRIGVIDSGVDISHSALASAVIVSHNFASRGSRADLSHGTMIASIIAGSDPGVYQGIAPGSRLLAANVFFLKADGSALANVESMILAIDWLVGEGVTVVNMSISGPPNRLLEKSIKRAVAAGTIIVAAVGNAGPAAPPLYPAAYEDVVAVTAVDSAFHVYRRAVRGPHVEFAAPGVDIYAADAAGAYRLQSGTSLAAPFVAVALAASRQQGERPWADILADFHGRALDLGEDGYDPVFGYGLIRGAPEDRARAYRPAAE